MKEDKKRKEMRREARGCIQILLCCYNMYVDNSCTLKSLMAAEGKGREGIYAIHYTQYTIHYTQYTIHNTQYTIHNTQYTIHNTQYAIHNTQYTIE